MFGSVSGQSFSNFINDPAIPNTIRKGTAYRSGVFHKIAANITDNETYDNYRTALKIVSDIIGSTHKDSLKTPVWQGIPELFGFLIKKSVDTSDGKETVSSILGKVKVSNGRADKVEEFLFTNSKLYV